MIEIQKLTIPQYATEDADPSSKEFSVFQFFGDGSYEAVRQWVTVAEAIKAAEHYTTSVGARIGSTKRVIITDGGDLIVFEWKYGEGITYPPRDAADVDQNQGRVASQGPDDTGSVG